MSVVAVEDVVVDVAVLLVVLVVVVGDMVVVTVLVGLVEVTVVTELDLCAELGPAPKNVVGCPLPVMECPATRSGTVKTATTIANASRPVMTASRQRCPAPPSP